MAYILRLHKETDQVSELACLSPPFMFETPATMPGAEYLFNESYSNPLAFPRDLGVRITKSNDHKVLK